MNPTRRLSLVFVLLTAGSFLLLGWMPSGAQLQVDGAQARGKLLYVRDGDLWTWERGVAHQLTSGGTWRQPVWSPEADKIAYVYQGQNFSDIFTMAPNGADNQRLTRGQNRILNDNDWVLRPTWTPDGTQIAFVSDAGSHFPQAWIMNANGSGRRSLVPAGLLEAIDTLSWSPDGKRLALTGFKKGLSQIYIHEAGKPLQQFTEHDGGAFDPAWSPDGERLAYATRVDGKSRIHVRPIGEGDPVQASTVGLARSPTWSPDGRSLAFLSGQKGGFDILVVDVKTAPDGLAISNERTMVIDAVVDATSGLSWSR